MVCYCFLYFDTAVVKLITLVIVFKKQIDNHVMFLHDCMLQRELLLGGGEESTIRRRNLQYVSLSKVQMSVMKPFISVPSFLKCVPLIQHVRHLLNFVLLFQNKGWNDICCRKHHREPPPYSSTDGSGMFACLCCACAHMCTFIPQYLLACLSCFFCLFISFDYNSTVYLFCSIIVLLCMYRRWKEMQALS